MQEPHSVADDEDAYRGDEQTGHGNVGSMVLWDTEEPDKNEVKIANVYVDIILFYL